MATSSYHLADGLHLRWLDDEVVVYLAHRFETHLIGDAGGQVLDALEQMAAASQPCTVQALYAWLLSNGGVAPHSLQTECDSQADATLMPLLTDLLRIGVLTSREC